MNHRLMMAAVFGLSMVVAGCSQPDQSAYTESSMEQNAKAAEMADEEVQKLAELQRSAEAEADAHGSGKIDSHKTKKSNAKNRGIASESHGSKDHGESHKTSPKPGRKTASVVYIVQVGAFRIKDNAERLQAKLKGEGYPVLTRAMNHSKNGELHLVRFEPTPNRAEADKWVSQLRTQASLEAVVLSQPDER